MGRLRRSINLPPDDVCDTQAEVDAYYADMEDAYWDMHDEQDERGDE